MMVSKQFFIQKYKVYTQRWEIYIHSPFRLVLGLEPPIIVGLILLNKKCFENRWITYSRLVLSRNRKKSSKQKFKFNEGFFYFNNVQQTNFYKNRNWEANIQSFIKWLKIDGIEHMSKRSVKVSSIFLCALNICSSSKCT